jgi:Na+-translocating ferredoxin:NAD+ oxidoreductase RNF subunit RnfB
VTSILIVLSPIALVGIMLATVVAICSRRFRLWRVPASSQVMIVGWYAECECGWTGYPWASESLAAGEWSRHAWTPGCRRRWVSRLLEMVGLADPRSTPQARIFSQRHDRVVRRHLDDAITTQGRIET